MQQEPVQPYRPIRLALFCLIAMLCTGCGPRPGRLRDIRRRGTLIVLTRNAPTTYYIGRDDRPRGPEYEMVRDFAHSMGLKVKFVIKNSVSDLLLALAKGEGDMIAAGMTPTPLREKYFAFGPAYQQVVQQVVCRRDGPRPDSLKELAGVNLEVSADSSYAARLQALRRTHPELHWDVSASVSTEYLLRQVWSGKLDCTVADSEIVAINRRFFPNLVVAFNLGKPQHLAWMIPKNAHALRNVMRAWMAGFRENGGLKRLMTRYYGVTRVFNYVDMRTYVRRIESIYPDYASMFQAAAKRYDLPPLVLAAQSYQESHWNPKAVSPTGVRGMMMLTLDTARMVGVKQRTNPSASIRGGAAYLARLRERLSNSIVPQDRIWFALAAYNIGLGHIRDARRLAQRLGRDPNRWSAVRRVLPLLSEPRYYRRLPHGYARGWEPVRYVERIRNFAQILRYRLKLAGSNDTVATAPG